LGHQKSCIFLYDDIILISTTKSGNTNFVYFGFLLMDITWIRDIPNEVLENGFQLIGDQTNTFTTQTREQKNEIIQIIQNQIYHLLATDPAVTEKRCNLVKLASNASYLRYVQTWQNNNKSDSADLKLNKLRLQASQVPLPQ
jgi:hypothetical protein